MVRSNEGLTLRSVDDQSHWLAEILGIKLEPCRETCAAKANKSALLNCCDETGLVCDHRRFDGRVNFLLTIRLDHDKCVKSAHSVSLRLDSDNCSRYAGMYRHVKKRLCVSDLLSHKDMIAFFDKRLARCADVLRHRDLYHIRDGHHLCRTPGRVLIVADMYAVQMLSTRHFCSPFSGYLLWLHSLLCYYNAEECQIVE